MNGLYTEEMIAGLKRQLHLRWIILAAVCVPLLALFIWSMTARIQWVSMASVILCGFFATFWIGVVCRPLLRYRALIRTALTGRQRTRTMPFARAEADISTVDGVPCRGLIFLGEPDKHGARDQLLYWDQEIPMPAFESGKEYTVQYSGRMIVGIE